MNRILSIFQRSHLFHYMHREQAVSQIEEICFRFQTCLLASELANSLQPQVDEWEKELQDLQPKIEKERATFQAARTEAETAGAFYQEAVTAVQGNRGAVIEVLDHKTRQESTAQDARGQLDSLTAKAGLLGSRLQYLRQIQAELRAITAPTGEEVLNVIKTNRIIGE